MRAELLEIMESCPVMLRLRLSDGTVRDFDTTEDCFVRSAGQHLSMSALRSGPVDVRFRGDRICEVSPLAGEASD